MKKILLAGNLITAEILCSYLQYDTRYEIAGVTVDDDFVLSGIINSYLTVGVSQVLDHFSPDTHHVIMAIGYDELNRTREHMFDQMKALGYRIETYIHPKALVYTDKPLGEGSVVLPGAVIEPHARVGANTMVWSNVTLAHHSIVDNHCWVAAGAVVSGQSKVLHNTFLGVNCTIVDGITVGEFNVVGAGAMISKNTKPHSVHLARSAEPFRYTSEDYVKYFRI